MPTAPDEPPAPARPVFEDEHYEVVDGRRILTPRMWVHDTLVANAVFQHLAHFARTNDLGRVVFEMLFRFDPDTDLQRRPDVAFVSYARWPRDRRLTSDDAWDVVPDLAVEVLCVGYTASDVPIRVRDFVRAGVRLVWVVDPLGLEVHVYDPESPGTIRVLRRGDDLDGGAVLPGFRLALATLFGDEAAPAAG